MVIGMGPDGESMSFTVEITDSEDSDEYDDDYDDDEILSLGKQVLFASNALEP